MLKAKNIYEEKAKQFELVNARLQLNEIEGNYRNHEKTQMNEEEEIDEEDIIGKLSDQFNENEMIFSDQNSIHGFNFPINNENTISMFTEMAGSTSISDCICFEIGDSSEHANIEVQKECDDLNMINELIYQNNQYLKLAASWKKQCQAIMMKMEEMKKGNYNEKNKEKMNTPLDKKLNL
ncbi:hypothetical protein TRFO_17989 [Tritrichomonas foetus]|uniref:Uncharacterized protein n=1 Tax=Tritrichomonas foetus TaxID=1144522 RepID=A0A1J4KR66_9EUKA|nr:hypothetical protein TRFO_17989 [Tritrichomonas foetus]|eukprot:OHT12292.1 hypothetical protein TRFO_17989 [Tritrichomonas foetus]